MKNKDLAVVEFVRGRKQFLGWDNLWYNSPYLKWINIYTSDKTYRHLNTDQATLLINELGITKVKITNSIKKY